MESNSFPPSLDWEKEFDSNPLFSPLIAVLALVLYLSLFIIPLFTSILTQVTPYTLW